MTENDAPREASAAGRRRNEQTRQAILNAADDLLMEKGFDGVTIEGIAARAGSGKQTIYRWWSSKTDVLLESLLEDSDAEVEFLVTGDPRADLETFLASLAAFNDSRPGGYVYRALLSQSLIDPEIAQAFLEGYQLKIRQRLREGVARVLLAEGDTGTARDDDRVSDLLDLLLGPLYFRQIIRNRAITPEFIRQIVHNTLAGLSDR